MDIVSLILYIIVFFVVVYIAWWVCTKFGLPQPVLWLVGALFLVILLLWVTGRMGPLPRLSSGGGSLR